ncbi:MAG: ATP-binding cassette domain-containing protein [Bacillota bacterium]
METLEEHLSRGEASRDEVFNEKREMIRTEKLVKVFPGGNKAVDEVSFSVYEGEIFGFLGPNGAGKSTTIMILTTLLDPTHGKAFVNGYDVNRNRKQVRMNLGYVSQVLSVDDALSGEENLWLQAGFYNLSREERKKRVNEVLDLTGLQQRRKDLVETYSGGMRKRLDIAAGLIHRPRVLFLDEPTLGLDIQTRREIWSYIKRLREEAGMTIFLTTHYMEEADQICDRIGIIDRGCLMTIDTPANLKKSLGGDLIFFDFAAAVTQGDMELALQKLGEQPFIKKIAPRANDQNGFVAVSSDGEADLPQFFAVLEQLKVKVNRVTLKIPSLDDVFLAFTGSELREEHADKEKNMQDRFTMRRLRS